MKNEQLQNEIEILKTRVQELENYIDNDRFLKNNNKLIYKSITSGSPTTSGYITVEINGIVRNIMIT